MFWDAIWFLGVGHFPKCMVCRCLVIVYLLVVVGMLIAYKRQIIVLTVRTKRGGTLYDGKSW